MGSMDPSSDQVTPEAVLDNPVWHALRGPLAPFADAAAPCAERAVRALRFDPQVGVFAAADVLDDDGWAALADLAGPGGLVVLMRRDVPEPSPRWRKVYDEPCAQMVSTRAPEPSGRTVTLGAGDVDEMLALTELTRPGPFLARTHEVGRYRGVRQDGALVAMAGERFRLAGWTEVSAVCTHPGVQGRGHGARLTGDVVAGIASRGEQAFLHVVLSNTTARRVYERLGFMERAVLQVRAFLTPTD